MKSASSRGAFLVAVFSSASACNGDATRSTSSTGTSTSGTSSSSGTSTASAGGGGSGGAGAGGSATGGGGGSSCETRAECAATWEQAAADKLDALVAGPPAALAAFLKAMP